MDLMKVVEKMGCVCMQFEWQLASSADAFIKRLIGNAGILKPS
jgi:hypothetical protein